MCTTLTSTPILCKAHKRNLKCIIAYNGTAYHGFQRQSNAVTVQAVIETALSKLLGGTQSPHTITGCSRTDAGVHAHEFCFNVKTSSSIPCTGVVRGLNSLLPRDIAVHSCEDVDMDFHARYDARSKVYTYLFHTGIVRDVFMDKRCYHYPHKPDIAAMSEAAKLFIGEHDFSAYCKAESLELTRAKKRGTVREIYGCKLTASGTANEYIEMRVCGNGFLHNMVRIMAGTLLYIGIGKLSLEQAEKSLSGGSRESAGVTLPPHGLYLDKVNYE